MNTSMNTDEQKLRHMAPASSQGHIPFRVPEGYFNSLQARVMNRIREAEHTAEKAETPSMPSLSTHAKRGRQWWVHLAVAAMFTGCFFMAGTMLYRTHRFSTTLPSAGITATPAMADAEYYDEILDYSMLSNSEIEYYLTSID